MTRDAVATDPDKLAALIAGRTRPALSVHVEIVDLGGRALLVIQVPPQRQRVGTSDGVFLRRAIGGDGRPACLPMDGYAIQSLQADRGLLDLSVENWLRQQVGPAYDALKADPARSVSIDKVRAALAAEHKKAKAKA